MACLSGSHRPGDAESLTTESVVVMFLNGYMPARRNTRRTYCGQGFIQQFGACIDARGDKHVAGDPTECIKLDMHLRGDKQIFVNEWGTPFCYISYTGATDGRLATRSTRANREPCVRMRESVGLAAKPLTATKRKA
jgi:hypothetical protein